jgi:hypothetical protein
VDVVSFGHSWESLQKYSPRSLVSDWLLVIGFLAHVCCMASLSPPFSISDGERGPGG